MRRRRGFVTVCRSTSILILDARNCQNLEKRLWEVGAGNRPDRVANSFFHDSCEPFRRIDPVSGANLALDGGVSRGVGTIQSDGENASNQRFGRLGRDDDADTTG